MQRLCKIVSTLVVSLVLIGGAAAQTSWIMRGFDTNRTGANDQEKVLKPTNVNSGQFGKLFSRAVDGQIYAQPLIVPGVIIPTKGTFTVAYVATMHDSVYAFDAENAGNGAPLWKRSFVDESKGITTIPYQFLTGFPDIHPEVGIVSTPAVDVANQLLYVVVRTLEGDGNVDASYHQRLYALDLRTGVTKLGPKELTAKVPGTGDGSVNGFVNYDERRQNQRPALVLNAGKLYIASASHGDNGPYHGWILCYDAKTFKLLGSYCSTPNAGLGGFWMSGHAMPIDAQGNLYAVTGNGNFNPLASNFGDSVLKIDGTAMAVSDYFTPYNQANLEGWDADLGSCGAILIPGTNLVVSGSKEGKIYVTDRTNMGHFDAASDDHIYQWWWACNGHMHGTPAFWQGGTGNKNLYAWSEGDTLKGFKFDGSKFTTTPFATSAMQAPPGMPGGFITVSSNGADSSSGIVWTTLPFTGDANWNTVPGVLRAFRATDLTELWNSHIADEDDFGSFAKFNPPVVVNGKVYVPTFSNELAVYGLLPATPPSAPAAVKAEGGSGEVAVTWRTVRGAASYEVRRGPVGGPYVKVGTTTTESLYLDKTVTNGTTYAYVVVAKNPYGTSESSVPSSATPAASIPDAGTGLTAAFYNDPADGRHFVTPALKRLDATVDYDWGDGSPDPLVQTDKFSAQWYGMVSANQTGYYTFQTVSDDGIRLWVRNQLVVDNWTDHGPATDLSKPILLVAGRRYPIQMEFYENGGGAVARLLWNGPGTGGPVAIPTTNLFPYGNTTPPEDGVVDLASQFNIDGMSFAARTQDGDIGFKGQTYAAETMIDTWSVGGTIPVLHVLGPKDVAGKNVIGCDGRTMVVPVYNAQMVSLLGCSVNGFQSGTFKFNYSDGTTLTQTIRFTDWGAPSPRFGEAMAARFSKRHGPAGDVVAITSLYQYRVLTDKTKRLISITLPNNPDIKILSLSIRR
ncbi:PA14 domain-containing protein [Fimbriimonas ginsengisoli]|uniref:PA14 domain protein n=1 Tax=Fimbriimonas ginsengisoli Gsoil 348 TaxID=661478 RepID=A0A068NWQ2_FIMGI|nr:PA14 domain-containing protein [Fimbriimonas ginsengisoli]AIE87948.1 PA14 domain protein [Fimbriimonas ginsengisoli Gsoil 348]